MSPTGGSNSSVAWLHRRTAWGVGAGVVLIVGTLAVLGLADQRAQKKPAPVPARGAPNGPSFALRAKAVYPVTPEEPGPIEHGVVIVRDGRIAAVGRDLELPPDLPLIDLKDAVVCPGFVSAGSSLAARHAGPHTVSAAYRALDAFDTYGDYRELLARGTTTVHLDPGGHRLVGGVGAVVKLAGAPEQRTLIAAADLTVTLGVFNPPLVVEPPFYASSDVAIEPALRQRPDSRLGQYLELDERIAAARRWLEDPESYRHEGFDVHTRSFAEAWGARLPLRIQVRRAADIEGALSFIERIRRQEAGAARPAYLVGLTEGDRLADALGAAGTPVVLRVEHQYRRPGPNVGPNPEALEPKLATAERLAGAAVGADRVALAGTEGDGSEDLRIAAMLAVRGGMSLPQALAGITRVPAEILGVAERVGSLAPGRDADLLVLTGDPLDVNSHVRQVYLDGRVVFEAPRTDALVVRAGTIWVGDGHVIRDGSLLIEDGKIQAVGQRVPHPPFAKLIDAGPDSFLSPGFIDAHGHLGLEGDGTEASPDLPIHRAIGEAGREFVRVARAGVTTVMLAPYRGAKNGARMAAIKTYGNGRDELVTRELTGLRFSLRDQDPLTGVDALRKALEAGKKYDESWKKYDEELDKWKKQRDEKPAEPEKEAETVVEDRKPDPLTGTWEYMVSGDPIPEPVSGTVRLRLIDTIVEGRMSDPRTGEDVNLSGTFDGSSLIAELDVETPFGKPTLTATLDREDHLAGQVKLGEFELQLEATRTDKRLVEFRVERRRERKKDGRPVPPKIDQNLEPYRPLLAGKLPAVVEVETAPQIAVALRLFVEEFKLPLVLLGGEDAADVADKLVEHRDKLGVIVPPEVERRRLRKPYNQLADLSRKGVPVALQSDSEDGARSLPAMGLFAVQQGMGGDAALRALTIDAARMYKLDDRIGSLEPGKDADVLIFDGHPFDAASRLQRVIVGGHEVPDEE